MILVHMIAATRATTTAEVAGTTITEDATTTVVATGIMTEDMTIEDMTTGGNGCDSPFFKNAVWLKRQSGATGILKETVTETTTEDMIAGMTTGGIDCLDLIRRTGWLVVARQKK